MFRVLNWLQIHCKFIVNLPGSLFSLEFSHSNWCFYCIQTMSLLYNLTLCVFVYIWYYTMCIWTSYEKFNHPLTFHPMNQSLNKAYCIIISQHWSNVSLLPHRYTTQNNLVGDDLSCIEIKSTLELLTPHLWIYWDCSLIILLHWSIMIYTFLSSESSVLGLRRPLLTPLISSSRLRLTHHGKSIWAMFPCSTVHTNYHLHYWVNKKVICKPHLEQETLQPFLLLCFSDEVSSKILGNVAY